MKELVAITQIIERRADILCLGPYTIVLSDCSAAVYLYSQSTSHSLMARYLSRLNSYPFRTLVRHKAGRYMNIADGISRFWTAEEQFDKTGCVSHLQGILVKTVFPVGTIVTPSMIVTAIQEATEPLVISTESPLITKACQTEQQENIPAVVLEPLEIKPDLSSNLQVNKIGFTQTGMRANMPNREKGPKLDDRKNISVLTLKRTVHDELNKLLSPDNYMSKQMTEYHQLYQSLIKFEHNPGYQLTAGLIMVKRNHMWVRYTPPSLRNHIITKMHLMGHFSHKKLTKLIACTDFWPNMRNDIRDFTRTCLSCLFLRSPNGQRQALGVPLSLRSCDIFQVDAVTGFATIRNKNMFVTCIDTFSRFAFVFPLTKDRATETVENLVVVFTVVGPPRYLITDRASNMNKSEAFQTCVQNTTSHQKSEAPTAQEV